MWASPKFWPTLQYGDPPSNWCRRLTRNRPRAANIGKSDASLIFFNEKTFSVRRNRRGFGTKKKRAPWLCRIDQDVYFRGRAWKLSLESSHFCVIWPRKKTNPNHSPRLPSGWRGKRYQSRRSGICIKIRPTVHWFCRKMSLQGV